MTGMQEDGDRGNVGGEEIASTQADDLGAIPFWQQPVLK